MKILFIADTMRTGGTEIFTVSLMNKIVNLGHECHLFVIWNLNLQSTKQLNNSVTVISGGREKKFHFGFLKKLKKEIKQFAPDVILNVAGFSYYAAKILCRRNKVPLFFAIHYTYNYNLKSKLTDIFLFNIIRFSNDFAITIYEKQIEYFVQKYNIKKDKFFLIHNGVDADYFIRKNAKSNSIFRIVHVANYRYEKDQRTLLKSLVLFDQKYKNWKLTFCGHVPNAVKQQFEEFLTAKGILNKIKFTGQVENVKNVLNKADVFILTSISEALPVTALEALAMSVPCILTDVGGCSDIIKNGKNGLLVQPKDTKLIAEKLEQLATDSDLRKNMGRQARHSAEKYFSLDKTADKYLSIFQSKVEDRN